MQADWEGAVPEHGGPAGARPDGVDDNGVHPGSHEEGVDDVGLHASALSNGTGHNGAGCGRELYEGHKNQNRMPDVKTCESAQQWHRMRW